MLSIIVAMDQDGTIGRSDGGMPWHLPPDLKRFRELTLGKSVVFGRKTWESIGKECLPGRYVRILSRTEDESVDWFAAGPGWSVLGPMLFEDILLVDRIVRDDHEIVIAGGREVYQQALPFAQRMYLTELDGVFDGDVKFPSWDRSEWRETCVEKFPGGGPNAHPYTFKSLVRAAT